MFGDGALSFQEFATREPHPLATIHDAVLEFLRGRTDVVLYGAHAVNAYVDQARMSQDVDLASLQPHEFAAETRALLRKQFRIAIRSRIATDGNCMRIEQPRKRGARHLVDIRPIGCLPPLRRVRKVQVAAPAELIASKVIRMTQRGQKPSAGTDRADLFRLLLTFPELKKPDGEVARRLIANAAPPEVLAAWRALVAEEIEPEDEDDKFGS